MAINTATNFSVGANLPIDERLVVTNLEALNTLLVYEGLVSYVISEKCEYIYQDGVWKKYEKENKAHISDTAPSPTQTDIWFDTNNGESYTEQQVETISLLIDDENLIEKSNDILSEAETELLNEEESLLLEDAENVIINEEDKLLSDTETLLQGE